MKEAYMEYRTIPQSGKLVYVITRADYVMGVGTTLQDAKALAALYGAVKWRTPLQFVSRKTLNDPPSEASAPFGWFGRCDRGFDFRITAVPLGGYTPGTTAGEDGYDLYTVERE